MPLSTGTRLGTYEIVAAIGAGGMGEVYRAKDARLNRFVAIKVLPPALAADPEARERFEREAKAVAALSDPNILAIHDFGSDGPTAYAVMELLEGETLRERLRQGPLPVRKAAEIARHVAHGLAAAHDAGLVHRDVKPENIFLTTAGHVKILDFGLARQVQVAAADGPNSPTIIKKTDPGTVMGTMGYMSPEQVAGRPVDARSDIFSLGCVLFEMVTGRRAFDRPTAAETMTAILREDPPDATRAEGPVPPALEQVIRHCLEKQPGERFQSARDLAFALQAAASGSSASGAAAAVKVPGAWPGYGPGTAPRAAAVLAACGLLAAGIVAGHYIWRTPTATASDQPVTFEQISDVAGVSTEPTLSPDGKSVVYAHRGGGDDNLYLLHVGARKPILLTPDVPEGSSEPAFSPDGERIAFRSEREGGGIFVMSSTGESVRRVADFGYNPSWSPDAKELAVSRALFTSPTDLSSGNLALWVVNVATGETRQALKNFTVMQPSWSPHGQRIAFWGLRIGGQRDIYTAAADGSDLARGPKDVTSDAAIDWSPTWSPDGRYLYFSSRRGGTMNLWRVPIDEASGRVLGQPEPITTPTPWSGYFSFSRDGSRLAFATLNWRSTLFKVAFDPVRGMVAGSPIPVLKGSLPIRDHDVSPDQQWVVFMESGQRESILVARMDGSEYRRLTDDDYRNRSPVWSPDGQRIAFYSDRGGSYAVWTMRPDGSGLEQMTSGTVEPNFPSWSPDGKQFAAWSPLPKPWWGVFDATHPVRLPDESRPQPDANSSFWAMGWSPDSQRIVGLVMKKDGSPAGVAVYDLAAKAFTRYPHVSASWASPVWLPDGKSFLVRDSRGITAVNAATQTVTLVVPVGGYDIGRSSGVTRDGRWLTYTETATEGEIWLATMKR
ncbi:MAG: protein kinase domain-containing protein [Vicinamibacterales bacterium]